MNRVQLMDLLWTVVLAALCGGLVIVSTMLMVDGCETRRQRREAELQRIIREVTAEEAEQGCAEALAPAD